MRAKRWHRNRPIGAQRISFYKHVWESSTNRKILKMVVEMLDKYQFSYFLVQNVGVKS